jgi:hypothetical protein
MQMAITTAATAAATTVAPAAAWPVLHSAGIPTNYTSASIGRLVLRIAGVPIMYTSSCILLPDLNATAVQLLPARNGPHEPQQRTAPAPAGR